MHSTLDFNRFSLRSLPTNSSSSPINFPLDSPLLLTLHLRVKTSVTSSNDSAESIHSTPSSLFTLFAKYRLKVKVLDDLPLRKPTFQRIRGLKPQQRLSIVSKPIRNSKFESRVSKSLATLMENGLLSKSRSALSISIVEEASRRVPSRSSLRCVSRLKFEIYQFLFQLSTSQSILPAPIPITLSLTLSTMPIPSIPLEVFTFQRLSLASVAMESRIVN